MNSGLFENGNLIIENGVTVSNGGNMTTTKKFHFESPESLNLVRHTNGIVKTGREDELYENLNRSQRSPSLSPSSGNSSNSSEHIIYDVPKSNEYIYAQPKSNASIVSVDTLIPQAARLILAQNPKNKNYGTDQARNCLDFNYVDNCDSDSINNEEDEPPIPPVDYDYDEPYDTLESEQQPYIDYGLQVIQEETESQMSSDSDQELDRCAEFCTETLRQRREKNKPFESIPEFDPTYPMQMSSMSSESDLQDGTDSIPDEIVIKHIKIPSDWEPTAVVQRLYAITPPKCSNTSENSELDNMEGHMQILSGNRKKGTFWNAWKRKFCIASMGKLTCYDKDDCKIIYLTINLIGGKVDYLDPFEFVGQEKGKAMVNRIIGVDDGKGHYYVFQCATVGEASRWIETLQREVLTTASFTNPVIIKNPSLFRDIVLIDIGSTNIRAGILAHQPTLPSLFFEAVISENKDTGKAIFGNDVYSLENRKNSKIRYPFQCTSKMCQNTMDLPALEGFMKKIFTDLSIVPSNYGVILTLPRRIDNKCRKSILQLLFNQFQTKSVLMCHQSVVSFWCQKLENCLICDVGERCDIVAVSQGFVLSHAWGRAPYGAHVLKHSLRQGLGPQENGLYLSTPTENIVLRYISENFICINNPTSNGGRKLSQDSQEIVLELDLRDVVPFSSLIGVNQDVLRGVAEGFFDPGLYGLDCESIQKILFKSLQDCGVDIRKEMSQNIFMVGGSTLIPGFPERVETELNKLCPPHIKPKIQVSPYRYHGSFIGASALSLTQAYEKSLLLQTSYDGGFGPSYWLI